MIELAAPAPKSMKPKELRREGAPEDCPRTKIDRLALEGRFQCRNLLECGISTRNDGLRRGQEIKNRHCR